MPAQLESPPRPELTGPPSRTPPNGHALKKVLIIDDTPEIRMIIGESLNLYGFTTLAAEDGLTGIQLAKEQLPDLIICDINMPNLDGYATLIALREHEATATIPFIFLTGAADKLNMRRGMELGADDYLTKPFTHQELMAAVNARLEKQADIRRQSEKKLEELRGNITLALPHELRTPLNGILGMAGIIMDDCASMAPAEIQESARLIHQSALRLHRVIENFLVLSQIELLASESRSLEMPASAAPVQVGEILPELARGIAANWQRAGDLALEVVPASLLVPPDNFKKIAEELIDNAFKFSEPGKPVRVATGISQRTFHLTVADHGRGLTAEQIARIGAHMQFERKTYEQQGAGLGLIIAKRLTELLGGRLQIDSKPGVQTTVRVSFDMPGE